jgi:hypothetical protein
LLVPFTLTSAFCLKSSTSTGDDDVFLRGVTVQGDVTRVASPNAFEGAVPVAAVTVQFPEVDPHDPSLVMLGLWWSTSVTIQVPEADFRVSNEVDVDVVADVCS